MPKLIMICGPNGGGKSTLTKTTALRDNIKVIDPDRLAVEEGLSPIEAGKEASRQAKLCLSEGQSFARESTLSGNFDIQIAKQAKERGFHVEFVYSGLNSAETAIKRVKERVANGGHDVPTEDIERRYSRSLQNLPKMLDIADKTTIYDNTDKQTKLVLVHEKGKSLKLDNAPNVLRVAVQLA